MFTKPGPQGHVRCLGSEVRGQPVSQYPPPLGPNQHDPTKRTRMTAPSAERDQAGTETPSPWHQPGRWLANPAYWDEQAIGERVVSRKPARFIDCTLSEGDDCVGHQMSWSGRLGLMERLSEA